MAKDLRIYHPDGTNEVIESLAKSTHVESANQQIDGQNSDVVNLQIRSAVPVDYQIGSYIDVYGRRYWLNKKGTIRKSSESDFLCTFKMEGVQNQLARSSYDPNLDPTHTGANLRVESLTADLKRFMEVLIMSSQEATPGLFTLGTILQNTETKTISFADSDSCLSVLQRLCQEYDTFFTFTPSSDGSSYAINIGQEGVEFPFTFKYGVGRGIYDLTRDNVDDGNIINRLKVRGSTRNIISSKYGDTCLLLPNTQRSSSYVEDQASIAKYGMWVGTKVFDDVYPHRTGTITALGSDVFTFVDSGMDFDLMATDKDGNSLYLLNGESAKIHFNSGQLAGMEFDVISYEHSSKKFVIKAVDDETGFRIPNASTAAYQMKTGDKYVLLNIYLPQSYITTAENELAEKAQKYLKQESTPEVKYSLTLSEFFLKNVMNENPDQNLFWIGDLIKIEDQDMAINASIKIVGLTRDLLDPYNYGLTIADQMVTATVGTTIINDLKDINTTIITNKLFDAARSRRNWRDQQQLLSMIFDPDGYFTDKIRPESVETEMLSVGAKSMQFGLVGTVFQPNYGGKPNRIVVNPGGQLVHYTIDENQARTWNLQNLDQTLTEVGEGKTLTTTAYYIYAKCQKSSDVGQIVITTQQHKVNDSTAYWFWIGVLNMVDSDTNTRTIALTYGFTTVNGRFIKTGRIQSADGVTYFDLDAGEIGGKIVFTRNDQQMTVDDLAAESEETKNYIDNTLPGILDGLKEQIDGQIEQFFYTYDPTLSNVPAKDWTTDKLKEDHLGDLFYNTDTGAVFRFVKDNGVYKWQQLSDAEVAKALATANDALALAKTKRRIFTSTPYTPYEVGDLWVQGTSGDIMRCTKTRDTGSYTASDWAKASKYTDNSALTTFVNGAYADQVELFASQIDGKIESWFQSEDPSSNWTTDTEKATHVGDTWFDVSSNALKFYRNMYVSDLRSLYNDHKIRLFKTGSFPTIDGKTASVDDILLFTSSNTLYRAVSETSGTSVKVYWKKVEDQNIVSVAIEFFKLVTNGCCFTYGKPSTPYAIADIYADGNTIFVCQSTRTSGSFVKSDWVEIGEEVFRCWQQTSDQTAIDAYNAAAQAQDTADGKRRIFVKTPYPPYDQGDLWTDGTNLRRCITSRQTGSYVQADWGLATNYDNTQTVIDGGIVTAGTVQLAGDSGSILAGITGEGTTAGSVRFWAGATKENRSVAPFRVLQDGSCYATKLFISGESTFEGKMKAVSGSFKNLRCVNNNGDEVGGIAFGSDGKMWFEGDLYHQGYDYTKGRSYRFYTSDILCRGQFGARERITMVVYGSYARIYYKGLENPSYYETINLTSGKATNGTTYYTIPCYASGNESAGMAIDMVLLRTTSNYRYVLSMADSQRVMVANINDQVWNNLWCNGREVTWEGGEMAEVIKVGSLMTPNATSSWLGAFQMVGAFSDNNWS